MGVMFVVFWWWGSQMIDPDFGGHIKTGELIPTLGVPMTDWYSYTMANFPWIYHGWLSGWLFARLYPFTGYTGLAGIMAVFPVLIALVLLPPRLRSWSLVPLILTAALWFPRMGVRPQVFDWMILAVLWRMLDDEVWWRRGRWWLPLLFLGWSNLHGGFVMGLVVWGAFIGMRFLQYRKLEFLHIGLWILSLAATTFNPYGLRIWEEIWMTMTDPLLKNNISEWTPFFVHFEPPFYMMACMVGVLAWYYRKSLEWWKPGVVGMLFLGSLSSVRHTSLFAVAALPFASELLEKLYHDVAKKKFGKDRYKTFFAILIGIALVWWNWRLGTALWSWKAGQLWSYPDAAIDYLRTENFSGEVFSLYGWGEYLVWKYPEKKVFIDGRMPSWRWESPDPTYLDWGFKDYLAITDEGKYEEAFRRFNVRVVLWKPIDDTEKPEQPWWKEAFDWGGEETYGKKLIQKLKADGWKEVYRDSQGVVYVAPRGEEQ